MPGREWVVHEADHAHRALLSRELSISPITASVLIARGVFSAEQARSWMSISPAPQHDPFLLPEMESAVDRLHHAVRAGERICFYGDYDVDGIAATSLYVSFFRELGADFVTYIPHRVKEGYGLHESALHRFREQGVKLIVTSDCGTTALREVCLGRQLGFDFIITDHHQPDAELPPAFALLNPHRADSRYPFSGLCSTGVAYRVIHAYVSRYGPVPTDPESLLDLVALATIADIVPLQDENRFYVREGLRSMSRGARPGLRALKLVAGVEHDCTSSTVAFRLAPRINAAGRLAHAEIGVKLLTTESDFEARSVALQLDDLNQERQRIEEVTMAEAVDAVGHGDLPAALVIWASGWHLGVVGIVAARLVERYQRPTFVIAVNAQGIGKGSARTMPGFNLHGALTQCRDLLIGFGGHPSAAGLTVADVNLLPLRQRLVEIAECWAQGQPQQPILRVDAQIDLAEMRPKVIHELDCFHPYGAGNPEPTLAAHDLTVLSFRVVGNGHLKLSVRHKNSFPFEGIGFRMGELANSKLAMGAHLDLAFVPELNRWNGFDRVQLRIRDIRESRA